ncbi:hypothetical protein BX070DRAFT_221284 [Coemansia spiralis]|nr:hypothetical protein BX070DRAFT_221284 [Coemansia spiralis]
MEQPIENGSIPVETFGELLLLESFLDRASRHALHKLNLRLRLGRFQERKQNARPAGIENSLSSRTDKDAASVEKIICELSNLHPKVQSTFSIVNRLLARTGNNEPADGLRIRSKAYKLLCMCFYDLFPAQIACEALPMQHGKENSHGSRVRSVSLSSYNPALDKPEDNFLWTLIRPCRSPVALLQLFLSFSAQAAQLQRSHVEPEAILAVGSHWYTLLLDFFVQLGLSSYEFGEWSAEQVLSAMDLVDSNLADRNVLYPTLWNHGNAADIQTFDSDFRAVRKLINGLRSSQGALRSAEGLFKRCSPHSFCYRFNLYISAVLDRLESPTLDLYASIRQSDRFPKSFFGTPDQTAAANMPANLQLVDNDTSRMLLDPFSPCAQLSAIAFEGGAVGGQSPSERVAQAHAYNAMAISAKRSAMTLTGDDDEPDESDESDIEMSPSRHASIKRQRSNDQVSTPLNRTTSRRKGYSQPNPPIVDGSRMDIDSSTLLESPSVLLSAKHDKRVRDSVMMHSHAPPALDFTSMKNSTPDIETSGPNMVSSSAMTTPKSQTGDNLKGEKPKYVPDRTHGDIEGGGRLHHRRHDPNTLGTPNIKRSAALEPPPQTLLSPKNIEAAQRKNIRLEELMAQSDIYSDADMAEDHRVTPQRNKSSTEGIALIQITPEHQIGQAADARASSASRYVQRREQGDTEGGGRKHRKRIRNGAPDSLLYMGS